MADEPPGEARTGAQLIGSIAVAGLIVALAIWAVTARLGPTSITALEAAEERAEEAGEAAEEKAEEAQEGNSGGGRRRRGRDR